jgi:uncharacterized membrane protein
MSITTRKKIRILTINSLFVAIIATLGIAFGFVPYLYGLSITILHIPVLIGAATLNIKSSAIFGFTFGLVSLLVSLTSPLAGPFDLIFNNPLVSILPRLLFGVISGLLFLLIKKVRFNQFFLIAIIAFLSTIIHTTMVLSAIWIFEYNNLIAIIVFDNLFALIIAVLSFNGLLESIAAAILVPVVVFALKRTNAFRSISL